jgi:hypothetical protein
MWCFSDPCGDPGYADEDGEACCDNAKASSIEVANFLPILRGKLEKALEGEGISVTEALE